MRMITRSGKKVRDLCEAAGKRQGMRTAQTSRTAALTLFWSKLSGLLPLPRFWGTGLVLPWGHLSDSRHCSSVSFFPAAYFPSLAQEPQRCPAHPGTSAGSSVTFSELPACGSWRLAARPGETAGDSQTGPRAGREAEPALALQQEQHRAPHTNCVS